MPLPAFSSEGLLPDGVHPATEADLRSRCVDQFPASVMRGPVLDGFLRYRADVGRLGINITQWVDGSFTDATRLDPDDIDLANFASADEINALSAAAQHSAALLLNGRKCTKTSYSCHTFLLIFFPPGHPFAPNFEVQRRYWRDWFATPQDYSKPPLKTPAPHRGRKGIVHMTVGDPASAPQVNP